MQEAHARFSAAAPGAVSTIYPALARVPADLFGICVAGVDGRLYPVGAADHPFAIMSVSKPFIFALVCEQIGATSARERIGANATGYAFNSVAGIERASEGRTDPMVNAGAIATTSLMQGEGAAEKWRHIREGLSRFAGRELPLNEEVYESAWGLQFPQPQHRLVPAECRAPVLRPGRGRGPLYEAMLAGRQRPGSRGDGCARWPTAASIR